MRNDDGIFEIFGSERTHRLCAIGLGRSRLEGKTQGCCAQCTAVGFELRCRSADFCTRLHESNQLLCTSESTRGGFNFQIFPPWWSHPTLFLRGAHRRRSDSAGTKSALQWYHRQSSPWVSGCLMNGFPSNLVLAASPRLCGWLFLRFKWSKVSVRSFS